jgi:hypothetical protein
MNDVTTSVEWFNHHQVVYCFGDSDILGFDGIACEDQEADVVYSCRGEAIPGQSAALSLSDDATTLSIGLLEALVSQAVVQHVYPNGVFEFLWNIAQHAGHFVAGSGQRVMPILLFRLGGLDCRQFGAGDVGPERIRESIVPYVRALTILKERGLLNTFACSVSVRGNIAATSFNSMLERLMQDAGIAYLDVSALSEEEAPRRAIQLLLERLRVDAIL